MTTGRVLVVDDAAFNRRLLCRLLTSLGHEVVEAEDGQAALDRLRADADDAADGAIDVVLLDIVMPVMDGFATLEAMQADDALRIVPVIVISDIDDRDSVVRCLGMGAVDHLPKSVDPEILRVRIDASLTRKRLHDVERAASEAQARLLATIDRQRAELSRFLSPQVAALVSSDDGEALLTGHRREITAMFCDLRQFTVFSETADPEEVLSFLRAYHGLMGPLIVEHEGTLEHFAGDGFMTFFNDPVLQADHADPGGAARGRDADELRLPLGDLGPPWPHPGARHRHRHGLRDPRPDRLRGTVRLRRGRTGHHPRRSPERRRGPR